MGQWSKWMQFTQMRLSRRLVQPQARWWRWGQQLGLGCVLFFYCTNPASAAETVLLQYADQQVTVSLTELKTFVETGEATPVLQEFVQRIPSDQVFERELFADSLPIRFAPSGDATISRNAQFILYQVNKLVGRPPGDENYPALRTALIEASQGRGLTLLRLIEAYPEASVRVELRDLERVYSDIKLFIERIQPLVQSRRLIEDWLCECVPGDEESPTVETANQFMNSSQPSMPCGVAQLVASQTGKNQAFPMAFDTLSPTLFIPSDPSEIPVLVAAANPSANRRLVFTLGPLGRSIAIDDLTRFAETGETTRQIRSYLRLVNLEPEQVRELLNRKVRVEMQLADRLLNNLLGEYVLFQASEVIHTRSRRADILAIRSAIILSLQDDNQISPIEFLQRYPTNQVYIDGIALLEVTRFVRRTQQNVGEVTDEIGDWLVGVQTAIAAEICGCEASPAPSPVEE